MREIKFRGKRKDNGEWIYGNYHHNFRKGHWHTISDFDDNIDHIVDPETVGQFVTRNVWGDEIYEGSILLGEFATGMGGKSTKYKELHFHIGYSEYMNSFHVVMPKHYGNYRFLPHISKCKLVGNIHDNPELLNQ
jgi:hypothetical protein